MVFLNLLSVGKLIVLGVDYGMVRWALSYV